MKDKFNFPAEDFTVEVLFSQAKDADMSLPGVIDSYARYFPIADSTKEKYKTALCEQAATKINECYRFATGVLHQSISEGHWFYIDINFKSYSDRFCMFQVNSFWHRFYNGKHEVMIQVNDYMANGGIDEKMQRLARANNKK